MDFRMFYLAHMTEPAQVPPGMVVPEWTIGDRMRKAREHARLSQAQMARELGVGRTSIVAYETDVDDRRRPKRPVVRAWSFRTGVPYEWLCHGDTQPCGLPARRSDGFATKMHKLPARDVA